MSDPRVSRYLAQVDQFVATARWQSHARGWVIAGYRACEWYSQGYNFSEVVVALNTYYLDDLESARPSGIAISQDASTVAREAMLTLC